MRHRQHGGGLSRILAQYPDSDLTATARKLDERLRNRPRSLRASIVGAAGVPPNAGSGNACRDRRADPVCRSTPRSLRPVRAARRPRL